MQLVDSTSGPSEALAEALWHSYDTTGQVSILWQDPQLQGWEPEKSYRWIVSHQPSTGHIRYVNLTKLNVSHCTYVLFLALDNEFSGIMYLEVGKIFS